MSELFTTISLHQDFNNAFTSWWQREIKKHLFKGVDGWLRSRAPSACCPHCQQKFTLNVFQSFFFYGKIFSAPKLRCSRFELIIHGDSIIVSTGKCSTEKILIENVFFFFSSCVESFVGAQMLTLMLILRRESLRFTLVKRRARQVSGGRR